MYTLANVKNGKEKVDRMTNVTSKSFPRATNSVSREYIFSIDFSIIVAANASLPSRRFAISQDISRASRVRAPRSRASHYIIDLVMQKARINARINIAF